MCDMKKAPKGANLIMKSTASDLDSALYATGVLAVDQHCCASQSGALLPPRAGSPLAGPRPGLPEQDKTDVIEPIMAERGQNSFR